MLSHDFKIYRQAILTISFVKLWYFMSGPQSLFTSRPDMENVFTSDGVKQINRLSLVTRHAYNMADQKLQKKYVIFLQI